MDRDTWNSLEESYKKAWDGLSDEAKTKIAMHHFNKGKECASQGSEVNKVEAKQHDLIFDESDDDEEELVKVSKHKVIHASNADSACKMHEDEGVDFDMILQAQQASTRLQVNQHELSDSDSSGEESVVGLEVNAHNQKERSNKPKIQGLLNFDSLEEDDDGCALRYPSTVEEALIIDARAKIDDPDEEVEESIKHRVTARILEARLPEGLLHFDDLEDKEAKPITYAFSRSKLGEGDLEESHEGSEGKGDEGFVGEQEADTSQGGLTES